MLPAYVEATGVDAVSIDSAARSLIRERVQNRVAVQGDLDPLVPSRAARRWIAPSTTCGGLPQRRLIFDLGHGIQPEPRSPMSSRC